MSTNTFSIKIPKWHPADDIKNHKHGDTRTSHCPIYINDEICIDGYSTTYSSNTNKPTLSIISHFHEDHILGIQDRVNDLEKIIATPETFKISTTSKFLDMNPSTGEPKHSLTWTFTETNPTFKSLKYKEPFEWRGYEITLYNASHMLGSAFILIKKDNKSLLYITDIGYHVKIPSDLLDGKIDTLITSPTSYQANQYRTYFENEQIHQAKQIILDKIDEYMSKNYQVFFHYQTSTHGLELMKQLRALNFEPLIICDKFEYDLRQIHNKSYQNMKKISHIQHYDALIPNNNKYQPPTYNLIKSRKGQNEVYFLRKFKNDDSSLIDFDRKKNNTHYAIYERIPWPNDALIIDVEWQFPKLLQPNTVKRYWPLDVHIDPKTLLNYIIKINPTQQIIIDPSRNGRPPDWKTKLKQFQEDNTIQTQSIKLIEPS